MTSKPVREMILQKRNQTEEPGLFISEKQGKRLTRRAVELIIEEIAKEAGVRANNYKKVTLSGEKNLISLRAA
ncbi:hypothetical protein DVH26_10160 [Paenibacillus sp. H1-7]|uniref:hypothetical protein n=1 Tax=Paenibacillus sp. H1-7 TaxID=2282849 RepID=UPI001EF82740|nr:hypothetical protein [Paenibacillus sp. H1-7]ULL14779.1 hypothetical protein DVH26_10160 [Paenibacillus sp. H1-7]